MKGRMDVCVYVKVGRALEGDVNGMCTENSVHPPSTKIGTKVASFPGLPCLYSSVCVHKWKSKKKTGEACEQGQARDMLGLALLQG